MESITSQQVMQEVKIKKITSQQGTVKEKLREGEEEKSVKSVKQMASMLFRGVTHKQGTPGVKDKVTTSQQPYNQARPGDSMSVKREVNLPTPVKEKSRVWKSEEQVKEMASMSVMGLATGQAMSEASKSAKVMSGPGEPVEKLPCIRDREEKSVKSVNKEMAEIKSVSGDAKSVMKKASKSKPSKEMSGPGVGVGRKLAKPKSRMVRELSSKWEGILTREDLPEPGGHLGREGPVEGGGEGAVLSEEHHHTCKLKTKDIRVKREDTQTFIKNINKYKCIKTSGSMRTEVKEPGTRLGAVVGEEMHFSPNKRRKLLEIVPPPDTLHHHKSGPALSGQDQPYPHHHHHYHLQKHLQEVRGHLAGGDLHQPSLIIPHQPKNQLWHQIWQ